MKAARRKAGIDGCRPMLEAVRVAMTEQDGSPPGDPGRGVRAVIAAIGDDPPKRVVLGRTGYDAAVATLEDVLAGLRKREALSRGAALTPQTPQTAGPQAPARHTPSRVRPAEPVLCARQSPAPQPPGRR